MCSAGPPPPPKFPVTHLFSPGESFCSFVIRYCAEFFLPDEEGYCANDSNCGGMCVCVCVVVCSSGVLPKEQSDVSR